DGIRDRNVTGVQTCALPILAYARSRNVSKIVIGKPTRGFWQRVFLGSIVDTLVRGSGEIDVYVISGDGTPAPTPRTRTRPRAGQIGRASCRGGGGGAVRGGA